MPYFLVIGVILIIDQVTKYMVLSAMDTHQTVPVIEGIFHITFVRNYGAAFNIFQGKATLLAIGAIIVIGALAAYLLFKYRQGGGHWTMFLSLSLIISGGLGNMIDRVRLGYVVDFFDFQVWPIFNVADIAVCIGCGLLMLYVLAIEPKVLKAAEEKSDDTAGEGVENHE